MRYLLAFLAVSLCVMMSAPTARSEQVFKATVCDLLQTPYLYNHKLIEVTGDATERSEYFSLSSEQCYIDKLNITGVWLEYGGHLRSGVKYCCNSTTDRTSPEELVIDGVATSLVDDARFKKFDSSVYPTGQANVTLVGRFFTGQRQELPKGKYFWGGYGHLGMYSLLVIQKVLWVEPR
jgi:hypothetical protein